MAILLVEMKKMKNVRIKKWNKIEEEKKRKTLNR
jgi:hypothetical protein